MKPEATYTTSGVTYQIFVQSFADSNADGIGDLKGIGEKLTYIKELGVDAIWLTPIHPSPSYHKYDVTDYYGIDPDFGTLADFENLVKKAHELNLKVIIDLVINHCSEQHPWFLSAKEKKRPYRDYFIWKKQGAFGTTVPSEKEATADSDNRKIWNKIKGQNELYYSFFWSGMPDLNYDNYAVRKEVVSIAKYWLEEFGVDGFRLDAAKHIFPDDRLEDTVQFWKEFKTQMIAIKHDVILIGEVWSDIKTQTNFATGFTGLFNFDLSYSILESVKRGHIVKANTFKDAWKVQERGSPVDIFLESAKAFQLINPTFNHSTFLSNHDQTRVMSFLGNNIKKAKLAAAILLTLPGSPFIYYGEELGMRGRKPDQFIREPMLWSDQTKTKWMASKHNREGLIKSSDEQSHDRASLLNHYKMLIHLRKGNRTLAQGHIKLRDLRDNELLCYERTHQEKVFVIIHNLSKSRKNLSSYINKAHLIFSSSQGTDPSLPVLLAYESRIYKSTHPNSVEA